MRTTNIIGINFSTLPKKEVLEKIKEFINSDKSHYLVTPNPEIVLNALKDEELFYIINSADIAISDGFGIKLAGLLNGKNIPKITGADILIDILKIAEKTNKKVGVINWEKGFSSKEDIEKSFQNKYPNLNIKIENTYIKNKLY